MRFRDRIRETTESTGTGSFALAGAIRAYATFVGAGLGGRLVAYCAGSRSVDEWEVGVGVVTAGTPDTLSRLAVIGSSNAGALVNFSAGVKDIFQTDPGLIVEGAAKLHKPCRVATVANIAISTSLNNGDSLDGVTLATGDRVLVKDQTTPSENGIWIVAATPVRAADMWAGAGAAGAIVFVTSGTVNAGTWNYCSNAESSEIVGTASLDWAGLMSGAASSTDNALVRWNGTSGKRVQDGVWTQSDGGKLVGKSSATIPLVTADGATITLDWTSNRHTVTLGGNRTIEFDNVTEGQAIKLRLFQDGTGGRTVTWGPDIRWPGGVVPVLSTDPDVWDVFVFECVSLTGGTGGDPLFEGYVAGQNFGA